MAAHTDRPTGRPVFVRPAQEADIPALAGLLVQLYEAELPGALSGTPLERRISLLRFTLEAQPARALQHRSVLCGPGDQVLATGMLQLPGDPPYDRAPNGTLRAASALLGYRAAGQLLVTVARSLIGMRAQRRPDAALLHSIVVDAQQRGAGLGSLLLEALEQAVIAAGYRAAVLQVLDGNHAARQLYRRRGYRDVWRAPRWRAALGWSSWVMEKELPSAAHSPTAARGAD